MHAGIRESTCHGAGNRVASGRMKNVKRSGGKRGAMAATTGLLGERHTMIPAGIPWFA